MKKLFSIFCCLLLSASMSVQAWVNVSPSGNANTPASVSYVKLTKKATAKHWQVDFYGSQYSEFRIADLNLSANDANVIQGGPYLYGSSSSNYVYNSGGNQCFTGGFNGEIGFVYLGYEDANGWPVYYVSAIAISTSTGNYIIYRGHLPVRSFESDGTTRTSLINNIRDERTPAMRAFTFDGATSNNEYESSNGDQFLSEISSDTDGDWYWNDDDFIYFEAANNKTTTNNYCGINFWVNDFSHTYNGMLGPAEGAYEVIAPTLTQSGNYMYWYISNSSKVNSSIVGYSTNGTYGNCPWNSYCGNWNPGNSLNVTCAFDEVIVETGKYGNIYMRVYRSGAQLYCTIGEPAEDEVAEDGEITVVAGEHGQVKLDGSSWGTNFSANYTAAANVTIEAKAADGYYFSKWDDENSQNPRIVSVAGDATYTAIFEKNKTIVHAFSWNNIADTGNEPEHGSGDGLYVYRFYWTDGGINYPSLELQLIYDKSKLQNYGTMTAPREGVYTMLNNLTADFTEFLALGGTGNNSYMSCYWDANNSYKPFRAGTITISQGANGKPYIVVSTAQGNNTHQFFELTVGEPVQPYALAWDANGGELSGTYTAAGSVNEGTSITAPTATRTGYTFTGWSPAFTGTMPSANTTYTAQWNRTEYTITYEGLEDETNSNPTSYNIESETITLVAPGKRSGYVFTGWTLGGSPITEITTGSTGNKTLTATWEEMPSEIVLEDNRENSFYDTFKKKYDGAEDVTVVYNRQFPKSKWATLCLPFDVNSALLNSLDMAGRVYEFKKAEGNAETGINLYFATAETIIAGKGYIVNANAKLAAKSSFRFPEVKINLESDKGDELNSQESYDALEGTSTEGSDIELVGTLRKGRLRGVEDGKNRYMGLKDNKIYYPNISTEEGSLILAYRGIFRFRSIDDTLNAERIRIVVDGEDMGELLIENGRMTIDNDATRKFVKDGVLYIEREGVIYDAQGKRVESL